MAINTSEELELIFNRNNSTAYQAMLSLKEKSEKSNEVYQFIEKLFDMIENNNSYIRTRGLTLIAYNAKWDTENIIDEKIVSYLEHITDEKPITSRTVIKLLPIIAEYKPELKDLIVCKLEKSDVSYYAESMRNLVARDIQNALKKIKSDE